jgi:uncharacterized membrane protein
LAYPGSVETGADSINDAGAIVGTYDINMMTGPHSLFYQNGIYMSIDVPGANFTAAGSINDSGVVADYNENATGAIHGFLYFNGKFTTVVMPGALNTNLFGLNDAGVIVGTLDNNMVVTTFKSILPGRIS